MKYANKLICRFVPKRMDIIKLSHREIKRIERWMNDYLFAILDRFSDLISALALGRKPIGT